MKEEVVAKCDQLGRDGSVRPDRVGPGYRIWKMVDGKSVRTRYP